MGVAHGNAEYRHKSDRVAQCCLDTRRHKCNLPHITHVMDCKFEQSFLGLELLLELLLSRYAVFIFNYSTAYVILCKLFKRLHYQVLM